MTADHEQPIPPTPATWAPGAPDRDATWQASYRYASGRKANAPAQRAKWRAEGRTHMADDALQSWSGTPL